MQIETMPTRVFQDTRYRIDGQTFLVRESQHAKWVRSKNYNFDFDRSTGFFARWGTCPEDDPSFSPIGPEILDLEISVNGCPSGCKFCYKGNTAAPATNMSFETFKEIIHKFPHRQDWVIILMLENGAELSLGLRDTVLLVSGKTKLASELVESDEIHGFFRGQELMVLE